MACVEVGTGFAEKIDSRIIHFPSLKTVLMVEETIKKKKEFASQTKLRNSLPKKVMWQTFAIIIDYLVASNKIMIDKDGAVIWIYNPKLIGRVLKRGVKIR